MKQSSLAQGNLGDSRLPHGQTGQENWHQEKESADSRSKTKLLLPLKRQQEIKTVKGQNIDLCGGGKKT
jgi:hypothetical protein